MEMVLEKGGEGINDERRMCPRIEHRITARCKEKGKRPKDKVSRKLTLSGRCSTSKLLNMKACGKGAKGGTLGA